DRPTISTGSAAGFVLTLSNDGADDAAGLILTAPLPAGLGNDIFWQIDPATGAAGSFRITGAAGSQVVMLAPGVTELPKRGSLTIHLIGLTNGNDAAADTLQGSLALTALVDAVNEADADHNQRAAATITVNAPTLHVSLAADADPINAGGAAGFTLVIRNDGPGDAAGVALTCPLPAGLGNDIGWVVDGGANADVFLIARVQGKQVLSLVPGAALASGQTLT